MSVLKGSLINVLNRLPVQLKKHAGAADGADLRGISLRPWSVWRKQQGSWIGWAGGGDGQQFADLLAKASQNRAYTLQGVILSEDEVAKFSSGFANEIIWPLSHDFPPRCNFDPDAYRSVNRKFAQAAAEAATEQNDSVWVHDYHLMLMAQQLRELGSLATTAFFLHIPFPGPGMYGAGVVEIINRLIDTDRPLLIARPARARTATATCLQAPRAALRTVPQ